MHARNAVALSALCALVACGKKHDQPAPTTAAPGDDAAATAVATGDAGTGKPRKSVVVDEAAAAAPLIEEAQVRALLDSWLAAQNGGDLAAYGALYAGKFHGVRRVGAKVSRFERDGWLADRARMFKKPMKVSADEVKIANLTSQGGEVTFVQTWAQGGYQDKGPKRLFVVREAGALRIAEEEMLASQVEAPPLDPERFAFVREGMLVISREADEAWARGRLTMTSDGALYTATRAADPAALPAPLQVWKAGRKVRVFGADSTACETTIGKPMLQITLYPHFSLENQWREDDASDAQIARDVWNSGTLWLVAELDGCPNALWASAAPPPRTSPAPALDDADRKRLEDQALVAYRKLPGYRRLAGDDDKEWDAANREVSVLPGPHGHHFVAISGAESDAPPGCGTEMFHAVFRVEDSGTLRLLTDPDAYYDGFMPEAIIDFDGDGVVEMIGENRLYRLVDRRYEFTDGVGYPNEGACW